MQISFLNKLWRVLKNGHLPVMLHSSAPPPPRRVLALLKIHTYYGSLQLQMSVANYELESWSYLRTISHKIAEIIEYSVLLFPCHSIKRQGVFLQQQLFHQGLLCCLRRRLLVLQRTRSLTSSKLRFFLFQRPLKSCHIQILRGQQRSKSIFLGSIFVFLMSERKIRSELFVS